MPLLGSPTRQNAAKANPEAVKVKPEGSEVSNPLYPSERAHEHAHIVIELSWVSEVLEAFRFTSCTGYSRGQEDRSREKPFQHGHRLEQA